MSEITTLLDIIVAQKERIALLEALLKRTVPHLTTIVRMPNIEYVADAHNQAIEELRKALQEQGE